MDPKQLRIVFMGTPEFAVPSLRALVAGGYNIVAVVTAPDKPAGRGQKLRESEIKVAARDLGLPVLQPEKLKAPEFLEALRALHPDLGIVIAFRMLPEAVWALPRLGTFNLHASLLPQYRGAAPINWVLIHGDTETGVTTFLLNHEIDKGAILGQIRVPIQPDDNVGTLYDRLMHTGTALVTQTVDQIAAGVTTPIAQDGIDEGTLWPAPKIFKEDCRIDWSQPGRRIRDFIRGLSPYPAAWSLLRRTDGEETTAKIFSAFFEPLPESRRDEENASGQGRGSTHASAAILDQASGTVPRSRPDMVSNAVWNAITGLGSVSAPARTSDTAVGNTPVEAAAKFAGLQNRTEVSSAFPASHPAPGTVESDNRTFIRVACADGWIVLNEIQLAGKKRMPVRELLLGLHGINDYTFL